MQIDMQHVMLTTIHMTTRQEGFQLLIKYCYSPLVGIGAVCHHVILNIDIQDGLS